MAKDFELSNHISILFLVLDADPKVAGHYRPIRANGKFSQFELFLSRLQHAGMHKAEVWSAIKFFAVIIHCFLDLYTQSRLGVVVEP